MIIQCNACEKKFNVPNSAITDQGRLVQCSSCGNKWTQYPIQTDKIKKETKIPEIKPIKRNIVKKKRKSPEPYSKEYMQQKWGSAVKNYASEKGLTKKSKKPSAAPKQKINKEFQEQGFGFFNYTIVTLVFSTFFVGILHFERSRLSRKFPFLEPYIDHFFETIENFQILFLDFFR